MEELHDFLRKRSREMRKEMTKEEATLWYKYLRRFPMRVHRQRVFDPYIVDFYIAKKRLAIEIDGTQHFLEDGRSQDEARDKYLKSIGVTVLRFVNNEVNKQFDSVCQAIWNFCYGDEGCNYEDVLSREK